MKFRPKQILGTAIILSVIVITTISLQNIKKTQPSSTLTLSYIQNKFKLSFNIQDPNKNDFKAFLTNFGLDENVARQDLIFELDSTSSAKLAFQTPINANLEVNPKKINLSGNLSQKFATSAAMPKQINIPKTADLALYSNDLSSWTFSRIPIDNETKILLQETLRPSLGNYFISFNSGEEFAFYFNSDIDIGNIDNLLTEVSPQSLQEQGKPPDKIYQLKFPIEDPQKLNVAPVLFENQTFKVFASSIHATNFILGSQETFLFPQDNLTYDSIIYFEPKDQFDARKFSAFLTKDGIYNEKAADKFVEMLAKVQSFSFTLKQTAFSALINLE